MNPPWFMATTRLCSCKGTPDQHDSVEQPSTNPTVPLHHIVLPPPCARSASYEMNGSQGIRGSTTVNNCLRAVPNALFRHSESLGSEHRDTLMPVLSTSPSFQTDVEREAETACEESRGLSESIFNDRLNILP